MNKNSIIILLCILITIILALTTFLIYSIVNIKSLNFTFFTNIVGNNTNTIVKEQSYTIDSKDQININLISSDIIIKVKDQEELEIKQYSSKNLEEKYLFKENNNESQINIEEEFNRKFILAIFTPNIRYEIIIPKKYQENIDINTISGDIEFTQQNTNPIYKNFKLSSTSGDILLKENFKTNNMTLKTVSGDIDTNNIDTKELSITSTSGDITLEKIETKNSKIKTISGSIEIESITGKIKTNTVSGDVDINNLLVTNNSSITTTSGDIDIKMDKTSTCIINTKTVSGDVDSINNIGKDSNLFLELKTTSGDISID